MRGQSPIVQHNLNILTGIGNQLALAVPSMARIFKLYRVFILLTRRKRNANAAKISKFVPHARPQSVEGGAVAI